MEKHTISLMLYEYINKADPIALASIVIRERTYTSREDSWSNSCLTYYYIVKNFI